MKKFRIYIWKDIKEDNMFKEIVKNNKDRLNDYINVFVFDKYEDMYDKVEKIESDIEFPNGKENRIDNYAGRTLMCRKQLYSDDNSNEIWNYSHAQGFIYLCDENNRLSFNTVSHEVGHAIIGYIGAYFKDKFKFNRYGESTDEDILYEELFCYMTGSLNDQILWKVA